MTKSQTLQPNREFDIATPHDILNFELCKLGVKAQFLDDSGVFTRRKSRIVFGFRTGDDHFARGEDKGGGFWFSDTHDNGGETLWVGKE